MPGQCGCIGITDDHSVVVDGMRFALYSTQRAQIPQLTVLPEKRMPDGATHLRPSHHLSPVIDGGRLAARTTQRAQVVHSAILPEKRMTFAECCLGPPDHLFLH